MSRPVWLRNSAKQVVVAVALFSVNLATAAAAQTPIPPIPGLTTWEAQMVEFGRLHCAWWDSNWDATYDQQLASTYYDQTRVMYQIADYTRDSTWNNCAARARAMYRDGYVIPNGGGVPGYWNFTTGLRMDRQRTGSEVSAEAAIELSQNAAFAADWVPLEWTQNAESSREVAYAILSYINAEALGQPRRARRAQLVDQAYDHMDQWFVRFEWIGYDGFVDFAPFMVGLTAHSLIRDWEQTRDPRLTPTLRRAADWLWANAWVGADEAMWYDPESAAQGAPDLNLLIAPMYAFLYWQTGDVRYRDQGDRLFAGGVKGAYLDSSKQFNQNYWWSFDYVNWRKLGDANVSPTPTTTKSRPRIRKIPLLNSNTSTLPPRVQ